MSAIKCMDGWKELYQPIVNEIIEYDKSMSNVSDKIGLKSIFSRNGIMVVETHNPNNAPKYIKQRMSNAVLESLKVCECCGKRFNVGYVVTNDEIRTCCEQCAETMTPENKKTIWFDRQK